MEDLDVIRGRKWILYSKRGKRVEIVDGKKIRTQVDRAKYTQDRRNMTKDWIINNQGERKRFKIWVSETEKKEKRYYDTYLKEKHLISDMICENGRALICCGIDRGYVKMQIFNEMKWKLIQFFSDTDPIFLPDSRKDSDLIQRKDAETR